MWYWHDGWGLGMGLMMLFVWAPLVVVTVVLVSRLGSRGGPTESGIDALEIARRAYARGDITRERYLQVVEDLDGGPPVP